MLEMEWYRQPLRMHLERNYPQYDRRQQLLFGLSMNDLMDLVINRVLSVPVELEFSADQKPFGEFDAETMKIMVGGVNLKRYTADAAKAGYAAYVQGVIYHELVHAADFLMGLWKEATYDHLMLGEAYYLDPAEKSAYTSQMSVFLRDYLRLPPHQVQRMMDFYSSDQSQSRRQILPQYLQSQAAVKLTLEKLRRLFDDGVQGMIDEELLDDVYSEWHHWLTGIASYEGGIASKQPREDWSGDKVRMIGRLQQAVKLLDAKFTASPREKLLALNKAIQITHYEMPYLVQYWPSGGSVDDVRKFLTWLSSEGRKIGDRLPAKTAGTLSQHMYHQTMQENGQAIKARGLLPGRTGGFTQAGEWADEFYGKRPIYLSVDPRQDVPGLISFKVNVSGLTLYPDLPTLISDTGAFLQDNGTLWWEKTPKLLKPFADQYGMLAIKRLIHDPAVASAAIRLTRSAAVLEPIPPERLQSNKIGDRLPAKTAGRITLQKLRQLFDDAVQDMIDEPLLDEVYSEWFDFVSRAVAEIKQDMDLDEFETDPDLENVLNDAQRIAQLLDSKMAAPPKEKLLALNQAIQLWHREASFLDHYLRDYSYKEVWEFLDWLEERRSFEERRPPRSRLQNRTAAAGATFYRAPTAKTAKVQQLEWTLTPASPMPPASQLPPDSNWHTSRIINQVIRENTDEVNNRIDWEKQMGKGQLTDSQAERKALQHYRQELRERYDDVFSRFQDLPDPVPIWRAISLDQFKTLTEALSLINWKQLGPFWSHEKANAIPHWGGKPKTVILHGLASHRAIDWSSSLELNLKSPEETELRLFEERPIFINRLTVAGREFSIGRWSKT